MTPSLGGRRRKPDVRDYHPTAFVGTAPTHPDSYASVVSKIFMQSKFGTCGAHAGAGVGSILFGIPLSPKNLWKVIKYKINNGAGDGYGLNDGTDIRAIFKGLQYGVCTYDIMPNPTEIGEYPTSLTIEQYSNPNEITPAVTSQMIYKIPNYSIQDNPSMEDIKINVFLHKAVILLVECGDGWWLPDWSSQSVNPLHLGKLVGNHFIVASSFGLTVIDGPNSWSTAWGDLGMFHFLENYMPHVLEMGVPIMPATVQYQFLRDFGYGETSADVHALQVRLGMPNKYQTGYFGWITMGYVVAYQIAHLIKPTGFVGPLTRASLNI